MALDIVYVLGSGSRWENNELRYSLRSVAKYITDIGNVYIVGERPDWINTKHVKHVFAPDKPGLEWKEFNIMQKVVKACTLPMLSREFIFINDDHFLLSVIPPLPFYYQQTLNASLAKRKVQDSYYFSMQNTLRALEGRGYNTINFDIHAPIIYDKNLFTDAVLSYDWLCCPGGYVVKSLYCNTLGITGTVDMDLKIKEKLTCQQIDALTLHRKYFSIDDSAICIEMEIYLKYLYPTKSKYEL